MLSYGNAFRRCPVQVAAFLHMTELLILIAGLPGSGKTTRLCQMLREHWLVFDDYKREAFNHSSKFRDSRKFRALVTALRDGVRCTVADIDFCKTESREEAEDILREEVPGLTLRWHYFANDLLACEDNIKSRNRDCMQGELDKAKDLSQSYCIPQDAVELAVRRNTGRREAEN